MHSINDALSVLAPDWSLDEVEVIEFLEGGYSNSNYFIRYSSREFVVRIPGRAQPFVDRAHEELWLENLPAGISAQLMGFDQGTGAMLSQWVEGTLLVDWWASREPAQLVTFLADLHSQLPDAHRTYDLEALVAAYGVNDFMPMRTNGAVTTCHNDLNPWNIIVTKKGWVTLDWEFVGRNDPIFDLVGLHQGLGLPEHELVPLSRSYLHMRGPYFEENLEVRLAACLHNYWLREYAWAVDQLLRGNERIEVSNQRHTALKKLRTLAMA
ncbi:MAG: phosphotransferase [Pseudomonadales bacterium]|jgi:aminoglycoside phosphotransferase (APT) family kinase protein|nr:phosphotransferase [Pseudomonadales bacterium]